MQTSNNRRPPSLSRLVLILFLATTAWKVWVGEPRVVPVASAQIPDSGLQRKVLIDEVRKTNRLLTELHRTIKTHTFKVRIEGTDNKAAAKRSARSG